jgi:hypothetical protein
MLRRIVSDLYLSRLENFENALGNIKKEHFFEHEVTDSFRIIGDYNYAHGTVASSGLSLLAALETALLFDHFYLSNLIPEDLCQEVDDSSLNSYLESWYKIGNSLYGFSDLVTDLFDDDNVIQSSQILLLNNASTILRKALERSQILSYTPIVTDSFEISQDPRDLASTGRTQISRYNNGATFVFNAFLRLRNPLAQNEGINLDDFFDQGPTRLPNEEIADNSVACPRNNLSQGIENKISGLLQKILVEQSELSQSNSKIVDALLVSDIGKTAEIDRYIIHNLEQAGESEAEIAKRIRNLASDLTIERVRKVAREEKTTIVNYSLVSPEELFVWVISPRQNDPIHFETINCITSHAFNTPEVTSNRDDFRSQCIPLI